MRRRVSRRCVSAAAWAWRWRSNALKRRGTRSRQQVRGKQASSRKRCRASHCSRWRAVSSGLAGRSPGGSGDEAKAREEAAGRRLENDNGVWFMTQRIAYVTGGMGGIGTSICQRLHKEGFKVVAGCGPNSPRRVKWLEEQKALGYDFIASEGNVGDWESTKAA
ncbi:MAG TPA: SDR family NAD(P)-dependent oxidoreductase, partial [Paraburkholderia sp.]|nr:SDR family NAD(P)-dependent oxidoreductase [Paraburkholderia sp.]